MNRRTRIRIKTWMPVVVGLLLLLLSTSPPTFGGKKEQSLAVEGCASAGSAVTVAVSNSADDSRAGTVMVSVKVDGVLVVRSASVTVSANGVSTVQLSFNSQVEDLITVGIKEDQTPY